MEQTRRRRFLVELLPNGGRNCGNGTGRLVRIRVSTVLSVICAILVLNQAELTATVFEATFKGRARR
jgi:hypothetical protein